MDKSQLVSSLVVKMSTLLFVFWIMVAASRAEEIATESPILSHVDQRNLGAMWPQVDQIAQMRALQSGLKHDDDHSNIELDKINDVNRYDLMAAAPGTAIYARDFSDSANSLSRLFSKILLANEFVRNFSDRKRRMRQLATLKEDKDYSFVGSPILMNKLSTQQQLQRAAHKLRDMYLARGSQTRQAASADHSAVGNIPDELSQVNFGPLSDISNNSNGINNDLMPKNREKRRRCKIDPNLGVKNPNSCDTDAYFGAADYSMRDIWDSVGR